MDLNRYGLKPQAVMPDLDRDGLVLLYCPPSRRLHQHEAATHADLARKLAALQGLEFGGDYQPDDRYSRPLYFVPSDTLLNSESEALGIGDCHQLFGGVVPFSFVATKAITHGLANAASPAPLGWSPVLSERLRNQVLPGYSAFSVADLKSAATELFRLGRIRIKLPDGIGGSGQFVASSMDELLVLVEKIDQEKLVQQGIVAETNLNEVVTHSVGQCVVGDILISYCGKQRTTTSNHGKEVYGGSDLIIVRGDFDNLVKLDLDDSTRTAITQACMYHRAALSSYPDIVVSRANYDVAQGVDDSGQWRSGVLEQSWRIGGASGAEVVAFEAFDANPSLEVVCASTVEQYGPPSVLPGGAYVYYQGIDDKVGPLTKYALIEDYAHLRQ